MAKKSSGKRDKADRAADKDAKGSDDEYEFHLPEFDEKAFMRRELESARSTFWTFGIAIPVGLLAWAVGAYGGDWRLGWLPVIAGFAVLAPLLRKVGFSEESTSPKQMFGNWFLLFFTALVIWVIGVNVAA